MRLYLSTIPLALAAASLFTLPAHSAALDEASDDADAAGDRAIIVVGQSAADEAERQTRATPGGTDLIRYQDYADKSLASLRDTLAFSPGVYTQPRYGQEIRLSIRGSGLSRGFHMRGLTLLQDGVPINLADDNGDFQELDPIFFDHLEVYRGANALRFGSGTLGGAINGVTPTGRDAPGLYLRGDLGSFAMRRGLAAIGGASGPGDYWAGVSLDQSHGDREHARRDSLRFHGNLGLKLSDAASTRIYASVNSIDQELPGGLTAAGALTRPRAGNSNGDQQRNIDSLRLQNRTRIEWPDADGSTRIELGLFGNFKQLAHPIHQFIDQKSTDYGAFLRIEREMGAFSATLGGEWRRGETRARNFVNAAGKRGGLLFDADQDARTASLYGEARYRPMTQVTLIAGGVLTGGFRQRRVRYSSMPARDGRIAFTAFSPKFGVLIEPTRDVQVFANVSRSAELPGFGEVFQTVAGQNVFIDAIRPQRAWTAELGARGKAGMFAWDVAVYRARLRREMLQYSVATDIPAATFNADRTVHQGVEAALTVTPARWLRLRQTWQYSDFRFRRDREFGDNRLPVVPRHVLRSELRIGGDSLHVSPNLEWVPQGPFADYRNTRRTPGYALVGLTAGATLSKGFDLFVDARNLTAKKAIGDMSAVIAATPASAIYYPVERRAVYGGVRARF